jgi:hypothetical protein
MDETRQARSCAQGVLFAPPEPPLRLTWPTTT